MVFLAGGPVADQFSDVLTLLLVRRAVLAPDARTTARLASWIKDTPELKLNLWLLVESFLKVLASGLGTLALVWATVVLLGGFSTMLGGMDFWFTTSIVFVETVRIVGYNSAPEARFFVDLPRALSQKDISRAGMASIKFVRILTMGPTWIALAPIFLATACMSLSTIRLVGIARRHYGASSTSSADAYRNGNLKPALILFYALVLTQGALFLLWSAVTVIRSRLAADLSLLYLDWASRNKFSFDNRKEFSFDNRKELIERYVSSISGTCIEKGVATTINTNLVSFAAELLLQSQHPNDHTSAVLVLHSLVIVHEERSYQAYLRQRVKRSDQASFHQKMVKRSGQAVEQICSSKKLVYRLVWMLRSEDLDVRMKENIAEVVTKLACKLRLADIPGGACCISSLLDPHLMKKAAQTYNFHSIDIDEMAKIKPLFLHGLVILGELAMDPENCTEMYNTMDLVPRIIGPVSKGVHMIIKNDATTVQIVRESLRVVARLTGERGECSTKLCHELTTKYGRTAENILWILSNISDHDMRMLAVKILSRVTLDEPRMLQFTVNLRLLLLNAGDNPLRIEAGKALIAYGHEFPDIQQLVTIVTSDEYSKEYRTVIAEMLAQTCAMSTADQDRINHLSSVANALSTVLKAIVTQTTNITEFDKRNRKFLASFLDLAVQIGEKLATPEDFVSAVTGLPAMGDNVFAETLKRIIEVTNDSKDEVCLAIIKSATKLVAWMTEIDTIRPGYYIVDTISPGEYFRQVDIVQKLDTTVKAMAHLERYVVMTGGAEENEDYVTLQTLVETAKNKLVPQQQ